jgi:hypothetical protein
MCIDIPDLPKVSTQNTFGLNITRTLGTESNDDLTDRQLLTIYAMKVLVAMVDPPLMLWGGLQIC